jgi:DNA-directed RNA polymerase subunit RPC12/RpoP
MRRRNRMMRLARPGRRYHAMVWLIGLAVLALSGKWWPGILVLVAISILLEAGVKRSGLQEAEEGPFPANEEPQVSGRSPAPVEASIRSPYVSRAQGHRNEWLPLSCPKCGAPTRAADVQWTGDSSAACPYCGSNLPLKKT